MLAANNTFCFYSFDAFFAVWVLAKRKKWIGRIVTNGAHIG